MSYNPNQHFTDLPSTKFGSLGEIIINEYHKSKGAITIEWYAEPCNNGKGPRIILNGGTDYVAPDLYTVEGLDPDLLEAIQSVMRFDYHMRTVLPYKLPGQWVDAKTKTLTPWCRMYEYHTSGLDRKYAQEYLEVGLHTNKSVYVDFLLTNTVIQNGNQWDAGLYRGDLKWLGEEIGKGEEALAKIKAVRRPEKEDKKKIWHFGHPSLNPAVEDMWFWNNDNLEFMAPLDKVVAPAFSANLLNENQREEATRWLEKCN